jgi:hypothetical protein
MPLAAAMSRSGIAIVIVLVCASVLSTELTASAVGQIARACLAIALLNLMPPPKCASLRAQLKYDPYVHRVKEVFGDLLTRAGAKRAGERVQQFRRVPCNRRAHHGHPTELGRTESSLIRLSVVFESCGSATLPPQQLLE